MKILFILTVELMPSFFYITVIIVAIAVAMIIAWKFKAFDNDRQSETGRTSFKMDVNAANELDLKLEELEVLDHMSEGHSNQEIADKTSMSINRVNNRVRGIFSKLKVNRRSLAVKKARSLNLIP